MLIRRNERVRELKPLEQMQRISATDKHREVS
jgi:hypothetical protein